MSTKTKTAFSITGPTAPEPVGSDSYYAALSRAQGMATRLDAPLGSWYVRGTDGRVVAIIERVSARLVTTLTKDGYTEKRP